MRQRGKDVNLPFQWLLYVSFHLSGCNQSQDSEKLLQWSILFCLEKPFLVWNGQTEIWRLQKNKAKSSAANRQEMWVAGNKVQREVKMKMRVLSFTSDLYIPAPPQLGPVYRPPSLASPLFKIHFHVQVWRGGGACGGIMSSHCVIALPAHRCAFKC